MIKLRILNRFICGFHNYLSVILCKKQLLGCTNSVLFIDGGRVKILYFISIILADSSMLVCSCIGLHGLYKIRDYIPYMFTLYSWLLFISHILMVTIHISYTDDNYSYLIKSWLLFISHMLIVTNYCTYHNAMVVIFISHSLNI